MLWAILVILVILWLLGLLSGYTMGGVIHILLVIAIVVVLIRVIQGRRPFYQFGLCPLLSAYPLNYNLFAEQLLEFLAGTLRDLPHKTSFDPDPFFCGLNGCNA